MTGRIPSIGEIRTIQPPDSSDVNESRVGSGCVCRGGHWLVSGMNNRMTNSAFLIGTSRGLEEIQASLALASAPPDVIGSFRTDAVPGRRTDELLVELGAALDRHECDLALVALPGRESSLIMRIRTTLRRRGVTERFLPLADDLLAGVGPRIEPEIELDDLLDRPTRPLDVRAISSMIRGRRVLITGAGGSIGSELASRAATYGPAELVLMDRCEHALFEIDRRIARRHPELSRVASLQDVAEAEGTRRVFERLRPELVLHAAAHKHVPLSEAHPAEAVRNNLAGSISAVEAAIGVGAMKFVLVSTDKAVCPRSVMGATKRLAELVVQRLSAGTALELSVVRFGNVLGSSGSVLEIWKQELRDGGPLTVTDPRMRRYLMTIPEAAGLVLQAAAIGDNQAQPGMVHVLDMGEPVSIVDLAGRFLRLHGFTPQFPDTPMDSQGEGNFSILYTGARPGEKLEEVLTHPGGSLSETAHPAVRTWNGLVPERGRMHAALRHLNAVSASGAPQAVIDAVFGVLAELDPVSRGVPSGPDLISMG